MKDDTDALITPAIKHEEHLGLVVGLLDYPDGRVKVWFKNGKKIILPSAGDIDEYIKSHAEELQ